MNDDITSNHISCSDESEESLNDLIDDIRFDSRLERDIALGTHDWTTETIARQIEKQNIKLNPRFQRRDAWTKDKKSRFIESLILGLPIPQIVLAEQKKEKGKYIVIDGKQRLLTLAQFFSIKPFKELKLTKLSTLNYLNNASHSSLESDSRYQEELSAFDNTPIRTIVIKNWANENILYDIFLRLNTGSVSLSPQELRQALHPGEFIDYIDKVASSNVNIHKILNRKEPDFRMRDVELLLRFFSFKYYIHEYKGNYKEFLDKTCKELNRHWNEKEDEIASTAASFNNACETTYLIFKNNAFRKWNTNAYETKFNRAIFDIMLYYFSNHALNELARTHPKQIEDSFKNLCQSDFQFLSSLERTTKSISATNTRLTKWGECLNRLFPDAHVIIPNISYAADPSI